MKSESKIKKINNKLKQEIVLMVEADQEMRKSHEWNPEIDKRNTERMKDIIKQYGWPGKSLVGDEAANGAWLLVQHADHDVEFQRQALELLIIAAEKGEVEKKIVAYLTDRVRVNSNEPQIFGTQFYRDEHGMFGPRPIEDLENLDARRKEFGLGLFSEYRMLMQKQKNYNQK